MAQTIHLLQRVLMVQTIQVGQEVVVQLLEVKGELQLEETGVLSSPKPS